MGIWGNLHGRRVAIASVALLCSNPALAEDKSSKPKPNSTPAPAPAPAKLTASVYVQQIGAPTTSTEFWLRSGSLMPTGYGPAVIVADKGNVANQIQSGASKVFILQWGTANAATQSQWASGNSAEVFQISPGAMAAGAKANAGGGNGGEYDIFGFEVDPGNSGAHNQAKEPQGAGSAYGKGNIATQTQSGTGNFARAVQIGWSNVSSQAQSGTNNTSYTVQLGQSHRAETVQQGNANSSVIAQTGIANFARVEQK